MRACILTSETKVVENVILLESLDNFIPYKEGIELAPQQDGEIGWTWDVVNGGWIIPPEPDPTEEFLIEQARMKRNILLDHNVDRLNGPRWEGLTEPQKELWRQYRLDLLNVPQQQGFPYNIIWPIKPE
jgi:hypothetical protein